MTAIASPPATRHSAASTRRSAGTPAEAFPVQFKERSVGINAAPSLVDIASALQGALAAGDAHTATQLLSYDAIYEDMALSTQLLGRTAIERYLGGALAKTSYGTGSRLRPIVGGAAGGGFEWFAAPGSTVAAGITALEVDASARISRLTSVYDGRQLRDSDRRSLVLLAVGREGQP